MSVPPPPSRLNAPLLTVAIPSHAGEARVPALLRSLVGQADEAPHFRVLIIDNASPTPLGPIADAFSTALDVRVVREPALGLANARNRALDEIDTPVIVFLDDDVTVGEGFIAAYTEAFASQDQLLAAGGPIRAGFTRRPPAWVRGPVLSLISIQDLGTAVDYGSAYPFGANMAFRMKAVSHRFSPSLGRSGKGLLSGEETFFFHQNSFGVIGHIPDAWVIHHVAEERTQVRWLARRALAQLRTRVVLEDLISSG